MYTIENSIATILIVILVGKIIELNINATVEEVKAYLTKKFENKDGELSKEELDMAAGGDKSTAGWIVLSIVGVGLGCAISAISEQTNGFCV